MLLTNVVLNARLAKEDLRETIAALRTGAGKGSAGVGKRKDASRLSRKLDCLMSSGCLWRHGCLPAYVIDDQTTIKVIDGVVEVVSEGHWKRFTP